MDNSQNNFQNNFQPEVDLQQLEQLRLLGNAPEASLLGRYLSGNAESTGYA